MSDKTKDSIIKRLPAEIGKNLLDINLDKAMKYLDEAVKTLPEERYCLLTRANARKRALDIIGASEDIESLLRLFPNDLTAQALKNDIEYLNLNFEKALMLNDKYLKQRKFPPHFFLGYMKCMDAILNSLAKERAGHPLRDHYSIIRRSAWMKYMKQTTRMEEARMKKRKKFGVDSTMELVPKTKDLPPTSNKASTENASEGAGDQSIAETADVGSKIDETVKAVEPVFELWNSQHASSMIPTLKNFPHKPMQQRTTNISKYLSEKYLGQLHKDKCFLEQISERKGFIAPNRLAEAKLKHLVRNVIIYLNRVQNLMRSTRPFFHIKYQERKTMIEAQNRRDYLYRRQKGEAQNYFMKILYRLHVAYNLKDLQSIIVLISHMVDYYHGRFTRSITSTQRANIAEAINVLRDGYFDLGLFSEGMSTEEKITRVKVRLGMVMDKNPSNDSLYNNLRQYTSINWAPKIKIIEDRLKKAQFPEEVIYFHYELARLYLELNKPDLVRSHAKKCRAVAKELQDMKWVVNTKILLIQSSMKQNNKMDSMKQLEKALKLSKIINSKKLAEFLEFAIEVVQKTDFSYFSSPRKIMKKRKEEILNLIKEDEGTKRNAEIMFRKLSFSPSERIMPILPGVKLYSAAGRRKRPEAKSAPSGTNVSSRDLRNSNDRRGLEFYPLIKDYFNDMYS